MDFFGSGQHDLITTLSERQEQFLMILHFTGGTFQAINLGQRIPIDSGDFNDDGCTDALAGGIEGAAGTLIIAGCNGTPFQVSSPGSGFIIAAVDRDGDGRRDLLITNAGTVSAYLSNGTGFNTTAIAASSFREPPA